MILRALGLVLAINTCLTLWLLLTVPAGSLGVGSAFDEPRARVCLDGTWTVDAPGSKPEAIRVPEMQHPIITARRTASYRRRFTVPASWVDGSRIVLRFDKVQHHARVYVNGSPVGEHFGNRVGFDVDVTEAVHAGAGNDLDVRVEGISQGHAWPGVFTRDKDAYRLYATNVFRPDQAYIGGDVWLERRPSVTVRTPQIITSVRERSIALNATLVNATGRQLGGQLHATVYLGGRPVRTLPTVPVRLAAGEERVVGTRAEWQDPQLWGPPGYGSPVLYTLVIDLRDEGGGLVDRVRTRFGFRELTFREDRLVLNGRPIFLLSTRIQEEPFTDGTDERHRMRAAIREWMRLGFNCVESHNESRPGTFYDVADEMGMLVISGSFCSGRIFHKSQGRREGPSLDALSRTMGQWCIAERNHPSIVMWNVCDMNAQIHEALFADVRRADPTRLLPNVNFRFCSMRTDGQLQPVDAEQLHPGHGLPIYVSEVYLPKGTRRRPLESLPAMRETLESSGFFGAGMPCEYSAPGTAPTAQAVPWPTAAGPDPRGSSLFVAQDGPIIGPPEVLVAGAPAGAVVVAEPSGRTDVAPVAVQADDEGQALLYLDAPGRWRIRLPESGAMTSIDAIPLAVEAGRAPVFPTVRLGP